MSEKTYRVELRTVLADWPLLLALLADLGFGLWALPRMPQQVAVHWNLAGAADRFGPGWQAATMPALMAAGIYLLTLFAPMIDPRRSNYALFPETTRLLRWVTTLLMIGLHIAMVLNGLGHAVDVGMAVRLGVSLVLAAMGNSLGRLRPTFFFGIRTPWTLSNDTVWTRTHRLAGRLWVGCGLLGALTAFLPGQLGGFALIALLAVMILVPTAYSYWLFQRLKT